MRSYATGMNVESSFGFIRALQCNKLIAIFRLLWQNKNLLCFLLFADALVISKPKDNSLLPIVYFGKLFRTKLIIDFCDFEPLIHHIQIKYIKIASIVTCPTKIIADEIKQFSPKQLIVIEDSIDPLITKNSQFRQQRVIPLNRVNIIWFGRAFDRRGLPTDSFRIAAELFDSFISANPSKYSFYIVSEVPEKALLYVIINYPTIASKLVNSVKWCPKAMMRYLAKSDAALLPYETPVSNCYKSPNRVELALYFGIPVLSNGIIPSLDLTLSKYVTVISSKVIRQDSLLSKRSLQPISEQELNQIRGILHLKDEQICQKWLKTLVSREKYT